MESGYKYFPPESHILTLQGTFTEEFISEILKTTIALSNWEYANPLKNKKINKRLCVLIFIYFIVKKN